MPKKQSNKVGGQTVLQVITSCHTHYDTIRMMVQYEPLAIDVITYSMGNAVQEEQLHSPAGDECLKSYSKAAYALLFLGNWLKERGLSPIRVITCVPPLQIAEYLQLHLKLRIHNDNHGKAWIFHFRGRTVVIMGSRNLSSMLSTPELTVMFDDPTETVKVVGAFDYLWKESTELSDSQDWCTQGKDWQPDLKED